MGQSEFNEAMKQELLKLVRRVQPLEVIVEGIAEQFRQAAASGVPLDQIKLFVLPEAPPTVKFRKLKRNAKLPEYKTKGAAGMDLYASLTAEGGGYFIGAYKTRIISTGVAIELPPGYEAQVRSRSGLASKGIVVANSPGTIDSDYQGEIGVILHNTTDDDFYINEGDRIAQLVISKAFQVTIAETDREPEPTERGAGGFGSTGT